MNDERKVLQDRVARQTIGPALAVVNEAHDYPLLGSARVLTKRPMEGRHVKVRFGRKK